jgi:ABC-type dipeptide/oligopeptide/nickel transport system permease subunit
MVGENLEGLAGGSLAPIYPALAIACTSITLNLLVDSLGGQNKGGGGER